MPIFIATGFVLGLGYGLLEETQGLGRIEFMAFVFAAIGLGATAVAFINRHSDSIRPAFKALPIMVATLCGLALGHFAAYLLGIDGRELAQYGLNMSWQANLLLTLCLAAVFGTLLGVLAALLSHSLRRSMPRA